VTRPGRRLLLDTSSLMFRAYFALPTSIADGAGRPVNAVRGYLDMTARLVADRRPREVVHVLDDDFRPAERVAAHAGYKAERRPDPEDLVAQFGLLDEVLEVLGAVRAVARDWEADDAIGALCAHAPADDEIEVVTGDRDLLQVVRDEGPRVRLLYTVRGVSEVKIFDEAAVKREYGVPPSRYADFATLRGDPSDGLPGVAGVGPKTARELVNSHPSVRALVEDAGRLPTRLALKLREARPYLEAMERVVPVRTDVEVELLRGTLDEQALQRMAEERAIESPVARLRTALERTARGRA
jgi:5'-3' exonuclease